MLFFFFFFFFFFKKYELIYEFGSEKYAETGNLEACQNVKMYRYIISTMFITCHIFHIFRAEKFQKTESYRPETTSFSTETSQNR